MTELKSGDIYNDGTYSGKVKEVRSDKVTIESQDDNGDVVDITIPISDADSVEQAAMQLLVSGSVVCPKTGTFYEIREDKLLADGEVIGSVPTNVVEAIGFVVDALTSHLSKVKDDIHSFTDKDVDDLLANGSVLLSINEEDDPDDILNDIEIDIDKFLAPGEEIPPLAYRFVGNKLKVYFK
jgi:hypothetical protein